MKHHVHDDRGSALVEFALVLPVFFLIVFGSMSAIWLVGERSHVTGQARDLARFASIHHDPDDCEESVCPDGFPTLAEVNAYAEAKGYLGSDGVELTLRVGGEVQVDPPVLPGPYDGPWRNQVISVTLSRQVPDPFGGIVSLLGVDDITYTSTAKARTE